jgi:hypothetical protein
MPVQEMRRSSAIERVAYSEAARELSIWFAGGRRYIYSDVPSWVYRELCAARSAGQFVNQGSRDATRAAASRRADAMGIEPWPTL